MIWLEFARLQNEEYCHVDDVTASQLRRPARCPYCDAIVIPKRGTKKSHHWAHKGKSCASLYRKTSGAWVPLYHDFTMGLTPNQQKGIQRLWDRFGEQQFIKRHYKGHPASAKGQNALSALASTKITNIIPVLKQLVNEGYLNNYYDRIDGLPGWEDFYQLSQKGMIVVGGLPLDKFAIFQEHLCQQYFANMQDTADKETQIDQRLFKIAYERFQRQLLYFLRITADAKIVAYKIGITNDLDRRLAEIHRALRPHFSNQNIHVDVLHAFLGRAACERYVLFRFRDIRKSYGSMSEFFSPGVSSSTLIEEVGRIPMRPEG